MSAKPQVTCVGEAFVDFISLTSATDLVDAPSFLKVAGGAPANVVVGLAKLGIRSAFVGKLGDDSFGRFVERELQEKGVDTAGIVFDKDYKTRLAFVAIAKNGDPDFEFWEKHPADQQLRSCEVDVERIAQSRIVNVGPFMLLSEPARSTAFEIAREARQRGCDVCFDPNVRLSLWNSSKKARANCLQMVEMSTIVRMNDQEARLLTGRRKVEDAARELQSRGPAIVFITLAEKGCYYLAISHSGVVPGFEVKAVDTTGCGDGFVVGVLSGIVRANKGVEELSEAEMISICRTANAVGAMTSLRRGAIAALPSARDLKKFLATRKIPG